MYSKCVFYKKALKQNLEAKLKAEQGKTDFNRLF